MLAFHWHFTRKINRKKGFWEFPSTCKLFVVCAGYFCDIYIFKDKLFVPLLAQIYENETYFPLQFIGLKIIWLAQRYTISSSLH